MAGKPISPNIGAIKTGTGAASGSSNTNTSKNTNTTKTATGTSSSAKTKVVTEKVPVIIEVPTSVAPLEVPVIATQEIAEPTAEKVSHVSIDPQKENLRQMTEALKEQAVGKIDRATEASVAEVQKAANDQLPDLQKARNQIDIDEAKALDNQVLYAEARGDRGGIGKEQYNSIQNTAAQNRLAVNTAQLDLTRNTANQIAELRSRGEYEKADKLLDITQSYLSSLNDLEQWANEKNISIDEFNSKIDQWKADYNLEAAKYRTDVETQNAKLRQTAEDRAATVGKALMAAGVTPSGEMLSAMGMTPQDYLNYRLAKL